jgi:hypothetical protein
MASEQVLLVPTPFCRKDTLIAESNITPWTDADFKRAAEISGGLFDSQAEQIWRWRDQNEMLVVER